MELLTMLTEKWQRESFKQGLFRNEWSFSGSSEVTRITANMIQVSLEMIYGPEMHVWRDS